MFARTAAHKKVLYSLNEADEWLQVVRVLPLLRKNLCAKVSGEVMVTDACVEGGGLRLSRNLTPKGATLLEKLESK